MMNTQGQQPAGNQNSSLVLTLSIGLQLLAFFVVLNASTKPDESRSQAVLVSVKTAFNSSAIPSATGPAVNKAAAQVALRSSISDAFSPVLDGRDVVVRTDGDLLWVTRNMAQDQRQGSPANRAEANEDDRSVPCCMNGPLGHVNSPHMLQVPHLQNATALAALSNGRNLQTRVLFCLTSSTTWECVCQLKKRK